MNAQATRSGPARVVHERSDRVRVVILLWASVLVPAAHKHLHDWGRGSDAMTGSDQSNPKVRLSCVAKHLLASTIEITRSWLHDTFSTSCSHASARRNSAGDSAATCSSESAIRQTLSAVGRPAPMTVKSILLHSVSACESEHLRCDVDCGHADDSNSCLRQEAGGRVGWLACLQSQLRRDVQSPLRSAHWIRSQTVVAARRA